ncbi:MAG TPA: hypothetical protein VFM45_12245, partial [Anaeromyxobacteraceae bacterium]|nr:hypothetical protein [Anaeromyxobacteraceae bacterium]
MVPLVAFLAGALAVAAPAPPEPKFVFDLATPTGLADSTWAALAYDRGHDELFAMYDGMAHVFNVAGMESFRFGADPETGHVERVAFLDVGEMLVVATLQARQQILRCDYRGERIGLFEPRPLPEGWEGMRFDRIVVQGPKVYLVDYTSMRVVVADEQGKVLATHDLAAAVKAKEPAIKLGMGGFWVDAQGTMYATMPYAFAAFAFPPGGPPRQFGTRGSSPGKFNIVGAVTTDEQGTLFILDRLRSVVMIFTPELKFVLEFGYRGDGD